MLLLMSISLRRAATKFLVPLLTVTALTSAQAADWRFGVQAGADALGPALGGHVSVEGTVNRAGTLNLRGTLEGNVGFRGTANTRLDVALLGQSGNLYYGGGLGSGVLFDTTTTGGGIPLIVYTPILLANVHGVVGYDFGGARVEGVARLGLASGVGVRASFGLR